MVDVVGGPDYRIAYPNGDLTAYVSAIYEATVHSGTPTPDGDETTETRWFAPAELAGAELGQFARTMFRDLGLG